MTSGLETLIPVLETLQTTYVLIEGPELVIRAMTAHGADYLGSATPEALIGQTLGDILPEIIGQEDDLLRVLKGEQDAWTLDSVMRTAATGTVHYLRFTLVPAPQRSGWLLLLITDRTTEGHYLQELMQNRNDLSLLRAQLAQSNAMLDFLLKRYLDPRIAEAFLQGEMKLELGGEQRDVTVLFADARGYTSLSEHLPPSKIVEVLNNYLNLLADAADQYGGLINQFQGDNMMVIFNARGDQPRHACLAVQTGIAIQRALHDCFEHCAPDVPHLHFGIGINSGPALVGNIGARWRYNFTAIGDTTNLASRITSAAPADEIWISESTRTLLDVTFDLEALAPMQFKGKSTPTVLYRVKYK